MSDTYPPEGLPPLPNEDPAVGATLRRGKTLTRPERHQRQTPLLNAEQDGPGTTAWTIFSSVVTFWAPAFMLRWGNMHDSALQQAWREKIALCFLIMSVCGFVMFFTLFLPRLLCSASDVNLQSDVINYGTGEGMAFCFCTRNSYRSRTKVVSPLSIGVAVKGWMFNISQATSSNFFQAGPSGTDITSWFSQPNSSFPSCQDPTLESVTAASFNVCSSDAGVYCSFGNLASITQSTQLTNMSVMAGYDWDDLDNLKNFFVINGIVYNFDGYVRTYTTPIQNDPVDSIIRIITDYDYRNGGKDATNLFYRNSISKASINCLTEKFMAGVVSKQSAGCFARDLLLYCALIVILAIVLIRFFMALAFKLLLSEKLARAPSRKRLASQTVKWST